MKRFTVKRPRAASPFFHIGGRWYADLLYNFGEALTMDFADVMHFLVEVPPDAVVIGRRLAPAEERQVARDLADADADTYARLIANDHARWSLLRRK